MLPLDAKTIDLFLPCFRVCLSTKPALKLDTLLDLRGNRPILIHISDGKWNELYIIDILASKVRSFYNMNPGYIDIKEMQRLQLNRSA
jgi:hypothetical protein